MAHKKGVGSSKNGRNSNPQYLGVKRYGGEQVEGGKHPGPPAGHQIPSRQERGLWARTTRCSRWFAGVVKFEHKDKKRMKVSVYPAAVASAAERPTTVDAGPRRFLGPFSVSCSYGLKHLHDNRVRFRAEHHDAGGDDVGNSRSTQQGTGDIRPEGSGSSGRGQAPAGTHAASPRAGRRGSEISGHWSTDSSAVPTVDALEMDAVAGETGWLGNRDHQDRTGNRRDKSRGRHRQRCAGPDINDGR